jgi:hypothetical protein
LIYPKIIELFKSIGNIVNPEIRNDFEKKVTELIDETIKIYKAKKR